MMQDMPDKNVNDPTQASRAGHYQCSTLGGFIRRYRQQPCFRHWLDKAIFMRQLGYPLSAPRQRQASAWLAKNPAVKVQQKIYGHRLKQLKNLLHETQSLATAPAVCRRDRDRVAAWRQQQPSVMAKLTQQLTQAESVVVVGNSPNTRGQAKGDWIDSHDIVIRFNHCFSDYTSHQDTGTKLDIWVVAPDYRGPLFEPRIATLITGPNMLWWRQNWQSLRVLKSPLASIPLYSWRQAVAALQAPPSAGFLVLSWLQKLRQSKQLSTLGFGFSGSGEYHNAIKGHQAVSRHNWQREQELLSTWNLLNNQ